MSLIREYIHDHIQKLHKLLDAKDAPHAIAGGTAIGVFFGFLPIIGFKTLAAMGIAKLTRCSMVAAAIGVTLHDFFWWMWPLIMRWQFQLGFWVLQHPHHFPAPITRGDFKLSEIFQWDNLIDIGLPLATGGVIIGIPVALFSYGVVLFIMLGKAKRRNQANALPEPADKAWEQP